MNYRLGAIGLLAHPALTAESFQERARRQYGERADEFLDLYPAETDAEAGRQQIESSRDFALDALQHLAADWTETAESGVYFYYFERGIPWPEYPRFGVFHTAVRQPERGRPAGRGAVFLGSLRHHGARIRCRYGDEAGARSADFHASRLDE